RRGGQELLDVELEDPGEQQVHQERPVEPAVGGDGVAPQPGDADDHQRGAGDGAGKAQRQRERARRSAVCGGARAGQAAQERRGGVKPPTTPATAWSTAAARCSDGSWRCRPCTRWTSRTRPATTT